MQTLKLVVGNMDVEASKNGAHGIIAQNKGQVIIGASGDNNRIIANGNVKAGLSSTDIGSLLSVQKHECHIQ